MSDHRYTAIFGGAVLTAGFATFAVYRILGAAASPRQEPVQTVVVAVRDVPAGVPVPREALGVASWPVRIAPPQSFASADSVVGRVTRAPLMPGEPVLVDRLATRGAAPGLEGAIDPSRRAMAVRVNEAASVSGLVRQNSRVDVLMAGRADGGLQATARVLMSDVRVLGVGSVRPPESQTAGSSEPAPSNTTASIVTLEVTPAQAEQLAAAEGQGAIQVVLRGYGSVGNVATTGSTGQGFSNGPLGSTVPFPSAGMPHGMGASSGMSAGAPHPAASPLPGLAHRAMHHAPSAATLPPDGDVRAAKTTARADSVSVIHVFHGGVLTVLRMDAGGLTSAGPAAPAVSAAPQGGVPDLRTADAHVGMGAHGP